MGYIKGDTRSLDNGSYGDRRVCAKEVLKHKLAKRSAPSCTSLPFETKASLIFGTVEEAPSNQATAYLFKQGTKETNIGFS